jgi:hypothetical protein
VFVNDALVFSKATTGRFPVNGEVEAMFEAIRDGKEPPPPLEQPRSGGIISRIFDKLRN